MSRQRQWEKRCSRTNKQKEEERGNRRWRGWCWRYRPDAHAPVVWRQQRRRVDEQFLTFLATGFSVVWVFDRGFLLMVCWKSKWGFSVVWVYIDPWKSKWAVWYGLLLVKLNSYQPIQIHFIRIKQD